MCAGRTSKKLLFYYGILILPPYTYVTLQCNIIDVYCWNTVMCVVTEAANIQGQSVIAVVVAV